MLVTSTVEAVPYKIEAKSGLIQPVPIDSHPLSEPVDISSKPSGIPVSSETSLLILPITSPCLTIRHNFSGLTLKMFLMSFLYTMFAF